MHINNKTSDCFSTLKLHFSRKKWNTIPTTVEYIVNKTFKYLYGCIHEQCGKLVIFLECFQQGDKRLVVVYIFAGRYISLQTMVKRLEHIICTRYNIYIIKHFAEGKKEISGTIKMNTLEMLWIVCMLYTRVRIYCV